MTKEEILAMAPGRELDALVGSMVLKLPQKYVCAVDDCCEEECCIPDRPDDCMLAGGLLRKRLGRDDCEYWRRLDPEPYSTDITAAMEVVEHFDYVALHRNRDAGGHIIHSAIIWTTEEDERDTVHVAETMPESICKAALIAKLEG